MNRYGKRCVLYPRVSTEMQVDGYSLEGQKNMLTRFADREEMIVVDTYEDAGKSGKSIEGRPAFQKMLRDIEDGLDIDYILVYKLSRFGRNAADILNSLELVQSYGVNLICIEEGIDSSQTSGKLLISVLSAVAEIERENIIEQTMNGRREKARQGGWNGGFAPYGYTLEDNKLMIEETEAVAIRKIFELYTSSEIGLGGIANQLNLQGIRKIPRQNGTLEDWTGHFIKLILDNPVYCGKIAYGRRTKEKVKGTKNDYQMKRNDDYILTEGQHKGIVSEEVWEKAHAKRLRTGVKQPSKIGRDRVHLLSGLLKCPVCGSPMYTNKHAWTNKDGTYKEIYYYVCSRNRMVRGKHCEYKAMLKKTDIEPMVIEAIREIVRNEEYAQAIKKRIGVQIDTKAVDKELEGYQAKLKEVDLNKTRLEREIDSLPADAKYRERKLHDMTLRLDSLYDVIVELEEKIEDARLRRDAIKQQAITLENIYKIMVNFDCVYNIINDEEKRNVVTALIKEIEIYRNDESEYPLKRIGLNFPVFKDGGEVTELLWDKGNTVDTCPFCLMLASRGWRRAGKKTLQGGHARHIHANCDCEYAVRFDSNTNVAGYDPEKYLAQYNAANGDINAMRRAQYAQNKDKINAQKRAAYAERHPKKNQMVINGKTQGVPLNIRTALKANPNYANGREYKINCQRCVQAYEFRRRGYDVEALPKPSQNNIIKWGNECFVDSNGNTPQFAFYQTKKNIQTELQNAPDGARYIIYVQWKGRNRVAHVFIAEKSGSSIHYVDPQTADGDVSRYLDLGRDGRFGFLRIDDKRLTTDMQLINATVR